MDEHNQYDAIDVNYIRKHLNTNYFGKKVRYFEKIDSTNMTAKKIGNEPGNHGTLIIAEEQDKGRGRLGRSWSSPKGSGIFMSLLLQSGIKTENASILTLIAALAVNISIQEITGLKSNIKWPNDIVIGGKKVCGILTEMSTSGDKLESVVIGIGINVNRKDFPKEMEDIATSLRLESKQVIDRNKLIVDILTNLETYCEYFFKKDSFSDFVAEYNQALVNVNRIVRIVEKDKEYLGTAMGINEKGALLVKVRNEGQTKKEEVLEIMSGEVSVRGVYGYV